MSQQLSTLYGLMALTPAPVKRRVFVSSFHADRREVDDFIYRWGTVEKVFTPEALAHLTTMISSTAPTPNMSWERFVADTSLIRPSPFFSSANARIVGVVDWELNFVTAWCECTKWSDRLCASLRDATRIRVVRTDRVASARIAITSRQIGSELELQPTGLLLCSVFRHANVGRRTERAY